MRLPLFLTLCLFSLGPAIFAEPTSTSESGESVEPVYTPIATPRGARPHVPFEVGEIDTVDTGSGNLTIRIPLGQSYEVGPKLSYRFQLVHNSNAWDFVRATWVPNTDERILGLPNPGSNAGLGWELHFGKLFAPVGKHPVGLGTSGLPRWPNRDGDPTDRPDRWMYVAPDGARYPLLRLPGRAAGTVERPVRYSKDGTMIRMRQTDDSTILVEMPDGLISEFQKTGATTLGTDFCRAGVSGCWRLAEIRDLYGNRVWFEYADGGSNKEVWTIRDSAARQHQLTFAVDDPSTAGGDGTGMIVTGEGDEPGDVRRVLETVELAAFNDSTATYTLNTSVHRISRPCPNEWETAPSTYTLSVPILESVELPEDAPPWQIETQLPFDETATCFNASGRVEKVTFPGKSSIDYGYANWRMPSRCTYRNSPDAEAEYTVDGVTSRTTRDASGEVEGVWTYRSTLHPTITADAELSGPGCKRAEYRKTTVDAPAGVNGKHRRTVHYQAVFQGPENPLVGTAYDAWQVTDSGLPYSKHASIDDTNDDALFLTRQIFECEGADCGSALRSVYRRYTSEYRQCAKPGGDSAGCFQINPQVVAERRVFHDDLAQGNEDRFIETQNADNTGSARFREATILDNFVSSTVSIARSTDRNYTATGDTSLSIDSSTGYLQVGTPSSYLPDPGEIWLLTPYDKTTVTGNGRTYVSESEFDDAGSVVCKRTWKSSGSRGGQDVVVKLTRGEQTRNRGLPVTEVVSGGEYGQLGTAELCVIDDSTANGRKHTYEHGYEHLQLASSRFAGADHYLYESDIDRNTGLEATVYDISGLAIDLDFDGLGRLTHMTPSDTLGGIHLRYLYFYPEDGGAKVEIRHNDSSENDAETLLRETNVFDGFGRQVEARRTRPGSAESVRQTLYDALGRPTHQTTLQDATPVDLTAAVRYQDYDVFDRPRQITRPDSQVESLTYLGIREDQSTVQIQTSADGTTAVTRLTVRDALGRVIETSNPEQTTTFTYDPFDRQIRATRAGPGLGLEGQTRTYGFDARGYLLSEDLPEVDGLVTHKPDALGLSRETFDGQNTRRYAFDASARLTSVSDSAGTLWKQFVYGSENLADNYVLGKLQHVSRRNADLSLIETYTYPGGELGKVGSLTTKIYFPERPAGSEFGAAFQQTFSYDRFGNVTGQTYPECVTNGNGRKPCDDGNDQLPPLEHSVTHTYDQGLQQATTSSLGPSAAVSYHPNLQRSRIVYGNGIVGDFKEGDGHMARPASLTYRRGLSILWTSGDYAFDGANNITEIGNERFVYDGASRLRSGVVAQGRSEELTYDAADNVTSVIRDGVVDLANLDYIVNPETNRLLGRGSDLSAVYNSSGSMTRWGEHPDGRSIFEMTYGPFRRQTSFEINAAEASEGSSTWSYVYGPGDVRVMFEDDNGVRHWTLRDLDDRIVREFRQVGSSWQHVKDFIHGPGGLVATHHQTGAVRYFHPDHLGTPRLLTAEDGSVWSRHDYYPFGDEIPNEPATFLYQEGWECGQLICRQETPDEPRYEFTGHERDPHGLTDNMLARTYLFPLYRFASVDPARDGWNLYTYVGNNPVGYVDPTGEFSQEARENTSLVLSLVPGVGDVKDAQEVVTGVDLITGESLTPGERMITVVAAVVPVVGGKALRELAKGATEAAGATKKVPNPGGRLGKPETREHVQQVAKELKGRGYEIEFGGGNNEEYIRGSGPGTKGSAFVDITASKNGRLLRVNTVDTLRDGVTPTARERRNAARIRQLRPDDHLLLVPKPKGKN